MSEMNCMKCRVLDFKESLCEDEFCKMYYGEGNGIDFINAVKASACPTVPVDDLISRQDAIKEAYTIIIDGESFDVVQVETLEGLPSAQSETFEWCHDCKEYDQEQHCCHRWTKVIRETVEELKQEQQERRWIPVSERLPEALQEVLVTSTHGYVYTSRIVHGDFEYGGNVIAWMPLPEPYKGETDCSFGERAEQ